MSTYSAQPTVSAHYREARDRCQEARDRCQEARDRQETHDQENFGRPRRLDFLNEPEPDPGQPGV